MTKQPEALRLAEMLETGRGWNPKEAAAELRRLHYLNEARRNTHEALGLRIAALEQAGRQALEALKNYTVSDDDRVSIAMSILQERLAQPTGKQSLQVEQQEPVAWMQEMPTGDETRSVRLTTVEALAREEWANLIPLYTAPQRREWVGLTDEGINRLWSQSLADTKGETYLPLSEFARAIEAKLKEKNNA